MDRITRLRIRNVRAIESVDLPLNEAMTVLIGENGAGKSTIIECLELLRKAADPGFMQQFYTLHRGMPGLLRKGATQIELGVRIEDDAGELPPIDYCFTLAQKAAGAIVHAEQLLVGPTPDVNASVVLNAPFDALLRNREEASKRITAVDARLDKLRRSAPASPSTAARVTKQRERRTEARRERDELVAGLARIDADVAALRAHALTKIGQPLAVLRRTASMMEYLDPSPPSLKQREPPFERLMVPILGEQEPHPAIERVLRVLRGIEVHVGFETIPAWAARTYQRTLSVRGPATHFPASRLDLLGVNLANAWSELRNRESTHWQRTMDVVRIGLGERVDSVLVPPDMGGGNVYLAVRFRDVPEPVLASDLSDGQIAWLAFVAMTRLNPSRSLLAVDEPDAHLHPFLLGGVLALLLDTGAPVVVSTHSDRLLDLLPDPAGSVRVCSLDERGRATVAGVDPDELQKWLAHYNDFGKLRDAGYLSRVLRPLSESAEEPE